MKLNMPQRVLRVVKDTHDERSPLSHLVVDDVASVRVLAESRSMVAHAASQHGIGGEAIERLVETHKVSRATARPNVATE